MAPIYDFDITSIEFLLYNNESGACSRLNNLSNNDSGGMADELELIDKIIRSTDLKLEPDFLNITEKFIDWGINFIIKLIQNNMHINCADKIMSHIDYIHGILPDNSEYSKKKVLSRDTLMILFKKIEQNFNTNPRNYFDVFSKIWILCETEIKDNIVFSTALNIVYELLKCTQTNDLIVDIFNCAEKLLSLHILKINDKICEKIVINALLNILKVVVRSEQHAFARLNFWWKFICALNAQVVCSVLFNPCVVPFLANLFGKYLTFDLEEKFQYSLYTYNCFNNYDELGSLCNHAMTQILRLIGEPYLHHMEKTTKYDTIKHWRSYTDILLVQSNTRVLLISFYYWCQTAQLNKIKSAPTAFYILETVFKSFSGRFQKACLIKQRSLCRNEADDDNVTPLLYEIIDQTLCIKRKLEIDLKSSERSVSTTFNENLRIMKAIIDSFRVLGDNTSYIPSGLKLMLRVLNEHLGDMGEYSKLGDPTQKWCRVWFETSLRLIDRLFPKNSMAFSLLMYDDIAAINQHWFISWLQRTRKRDVPEFRKLGEHCAVTNLQCWYYLTVKLCPRLDKDSFTVYSSTECHPVPFTEYLVLPVFLVTQLGPDVLTSDDYQGLWKMWDHIYIDLVAKAQLLGSSASQQWSQAMVKGLRPILKSVRANMGSMPRRQMLLSFNFVCRCLRLVVLRADDCVEAVAWTKSLHSLLVELSSCFGDFSPDHVRLEFGKDSAESSSSEENERSDLLVDLVPVPVHNAKWSKARLGYVSRFQCDMDSNFDTFLSLLNVVIYKLAHDETTMIRILELIGTKLAPLTLALVANKKAEQSQPFDPNSPKLTRSRIAYDANISQLENFLSHLLTRVQITCFKKNITSDAVARISPVIVYILSTEFWTLSRSTVQFAVRLWNDIVLASEKQTQSVEYPEELVRVITQMKVNNKAIEIPESMRSQLAQVEIPKDLVHQDSFEMTTPSKPTQFGSILHKIQTKPDSPLKFTESVVLDHFSQPDIDSQLLTNNAVSAIAMPTKSPIINKSFTIQTATPTKSSPINKKQTKSPITNLTPTKSLQINVTPTKSLQINVTPTKSLQITVSPTKASKSNVTNSSINLTPTKSSRNVNVTPTKSSEIHTTPTKLIGYTTPTKEQQINITSMDMLSPIAKSAPIKEFSSPSLEIPRRVTRKRSYFDLSRKCSDADYVVIEPSCGGKRTRLTEHQKEHFEENRTQYKPIITTELEGNLPRLNLVHQDSVASNDTVLLPMPSDSTDIDLLDDCYDDINQEVLIGEEVEKQEDAISIAISSDSEDISQDRNLANENKENIDESVSSPGKNTDKLNKDCVTDHKQDLEVALLESTEPVLGLVIKTEEYLERVGDREKIPFVDLNKNNAARPPLSPGRHGPVIRLSSGRLINSPFGSSPQCASGARSPLINRSLGMSPGLGCSPNGSMMRSKRCVQMVLDSQKRTGPLASPVTTPVSSKVKQTGIIRHMLSERKKDVRVSFSIPIESGPNENRNIKIENESTFLSPVPERASEFSTVMPDQLCINLSNSLLDDNGESRPDSMSLLEETRLSLSEIVQDFSPIRPPRENQTFDEVFQQLKDIIQNETDDKKKKDMIKNMLSFVMPMIDKYL